MVWVRMGQLVYGASNTDLENLLDNEDCNCSEAPAQIMSAKKIQKSFMRSSCRDGICSSAETVRLIGIALRSKKNASLAVKRFLEYLQYRDTGQNFKCKAGDENA